jgi:hypothetical protein
MFVIVWWLALCAVSVANIAVWIAVATRLSRSRVHLHGEPEVHRADRWQLVLSALFVAVCAFRSFLPRAEGQRIVLYDAWLSNAMLGRAAATVAELALVAQWSLILFGWARAAGDARLATVARLLVPFILIAEVCSWYTALTTNFIGSVFEESTWAITATLLTISLIALWRRHPPMRTRFLAVSILLVSIYVGFMSLVDVPMYHARWVADTARGAHYLTVAEGWRDSQDRRVFTRRWEDWHEEIPWMSLYFSAGVWISLALVGAPRYPSAPRA